jgi:hypothetical protein
VAVADGHLHFGLRRDGAYIDPAPSLGRLVTLPRLVPIDGTRRNPPGRLLVRCGR